MLNFLASWRRERTVLRELSRLSDRELADLGVARSDIRAIADGSFGQAEPRASRDVRGTMAPAWGAHARQSAAA
jgi:uncharacterized protein YjiS (DUF1127 family)